MRAVSGDVNPRRGATTHICAQITTHYGFDGKPALAPASVGQSQTSTQVTKIIRIPVDASDADRATLMSLNNPEKGVYVVMGLQEDKD